MDKMRLSLLVLCCGFLSSGHRAKVAAQANNDCDLSDLDPYGLGEVGIFSTETLKDDGITEEVVAKQLEVNEKSDPDLASTIEATEKLREAAESGQLSAEYTDLSGDDARNYLQIYWPTCPVRYFWIRRTYYFSVGTQQNRKYCWAYYSVLAATCVQRYCRNSRLNNVFFYWRYRCFQYYSYVWFRARCVTLSSSGQMTWTTEYIRRRVPRGCYCKRFPLFEIPGLAADNVCPRTE